MISHHIFDLIHSYGNVIIIARPVFLYPFHIVVTLYKHLIVPMEMFSFQCIENFMHIYFLSMKKERKKNVFAIEIVVVCIQLMTTRTTIQKKRKKM